MTPPVRQSPPRAGDPYGLGIVGSFLAPVLAIVGLLIVAIITINLLNGELPLGLGRGTGTNGGTTGDGGPARTPAPSNVVVVPEPSTPTDEPLFLGAMTYAKAGNIWVQTDDGPTQLTDSGTASMPSWSPDGKYVYYIETKRSRGFWPVNGRPGTYDMEVPHLMRVPVDRSGPPEDLHSGRFREGNLIWFSWMRQPVVSPSGRTVAMVTDQPRPDERDVVVQLFSLENGKFTRPDLPVTSPLGHQDPAWRPDELRQIRAIAPGLAFLVPGVGAQGGDVEAVLTAGPATAPPAGGRSGGGLIVNVSRGISGTARGDGDGSTGDPLERVAAAAREWAARLPVLP